MQKLIMLLILGCSLQVFAHGEDKPGPHGGEIRMPGGFHTELMVAEDQSAHVFLLDMNFENPTVQDSKIDIQFVGGTKAKPVKISFNCSVMGKNHFHCIPQKAYPKKGELKVLATREKAVGQAVTYAIPWKAPLAKTKGHH